MSSRSVLAARAGFATPTEVVAAASARLVARDGRDLLQHLIDAGVLTPEQREVLSGFARQAIRYGLGTDLLDARTGERLVSIAISKPGGANWELRDLPRPDEGDPRASLQRVLTEAGLELRGVELVDVLPSP